MTSHDEIREHLADLISSRIEPDQRRRVEAHLAGCTECRELVKDLEEMRKQVREAGESIFEPHPDPSALHRIGSGERGAQDTQIERHLAACPTCRLEVEAWKRIQASKGPARLTPGGVTRLEPSARPAASALWIGLSAAAGIVLGCLVTLLIVSSKTPRLHPPPSGGSPTADHQASIPTLQPVLHVLPELLRDEQIPVQKWVLDPAEPYVSVAVPLTLPVKASDAERFRFEMVRAGQEEAVWSSEMTAARIREHLKASDLVSLSVILPRSLEAGSYEFRMLSSDTPDRPPLYRAGIELSYRQSPAATNAPQ